MNRIRKSVFVLQLIFLVSFTSAFSLDIPRFVEETTTAPLGCHRRLYTYEVIQIDSNGRQCWDNVTVLSCLGRCASSEIPDWRYPFKIAHHPVCVHALRSRAVTMLRHCDPDVDPETRQYEYLEAMACHCQTCSSKDTNCLHSKKNETDDTVLAMDGRNLNNLEYLI